MKELPCGHYIVDSSLCNCAVCGKPIIHVDLAVERCRAEALKLERDDIDDGFVKLAREELNRTQANEIDENKRQFLKWAPLFLSGLALSVASANFVCSLLGEITFRHQKHINWTLIIEAIEHAMESGSKHERLQKLAEQYRSASNELAARLCDAADYHLFSGMPLNAEKIYSTLVENDSLWDGLHKSVKSHTLIRYGKVCNNLGRHIVAASSFERIVSENLTINRDQEVSIIREALNARYQSFPGSWLLQGLPNAGAQDVGNLQSLLSIAAETVGVSDIRESSSSLGGMKAGIGLFAETLEYLQSGKNEHLESHLDYIRELINFKATTGWNRYSQFIALSLAGGEVDIALRALNEALSWILERSLNHRETMVAATELARGAIRPSANRDPGKIELALHLAMWGQYYWKLADTTKQTEPLVQASAFFKSARNILAKTQNSRFMRDIERLIAATEGGDLPDALGIPAWVRSYGPPAFSTGVFLPFAPTSLSV